MQLIHRATKVVGKIANYLIHLKWKNNREASGARQDDVGIEQNSHYWVTPLTSQPRAAQGSGSIVALYAADSSGICTAHEIGREHARDPHRIPMTCSHVSSKWTVSSLLI